MVRYMDIPEQIVLALVTAALFMVFLYEQPTEARAHTHIQRELACFAMLMFFLLIFPFLASVSQQASVSAPLYPCCAAVALCIALSQHLSCPTVCRACHLGHHVGA